MSEPEKFLQNFLQRWSRRKLAGAERDSEEPKAQPESGDGAVPNADDGTPPHEADADAASAFDPKSLPPIELIDAASDIRAFLAPGVPAEVARAALRRAWVSDPAICDFVGLAENQWDFAKPDAVPGFGSLDPTPALRRMVTALFSGAPEDGVQSDSAGDAENIVGKTAGADLPQPPRRQRPQPAPWRAGLETLGKSATNMLRCSRVSPATSPRGASASTAARCRSHGAFHSL